VANPKSRSPKRLSARHQRFVSEYLIDLNGTQAAIRAGYSAKSARFTAVDLLARDDVQAALVVGKEAREAESSIKASRVLEELARIAFSDVRQVVTWARRVLPAEDTSEAGPKEWTELKIRPSAEVDESAAAAIAEVSEGTDGRLKLKMHNKLRALELIARHLGLLDRDTLGRGGGEKPIVLTPENVGDLAERARLRLIAPAG